MMSSEPFYNEKIYTDTACLVLWALLVAGFCFRVVHMMGPIDEFSAWRQAETAYMTLRMAEESPPEFLHSKVPYRGTRDVHLAELPIQPLITAYGYKLLGRESLLLARLVTLFFFYAGAGILYLVFRRLQPKATAFLAIVIYTWLPLGIGYSRAVHVDFCVLFFSYLYLYFALRFFETDRWRFWGLSTLAATVAFAMKAPYCFFLGLPLLIYVWHDRAHRKGRTFVVICTLFALPLLAAAVYNEYRIALESGETESLVYCMKWTPELSRTHFFGSLGQRLDASRWKLVLRRLWWWVCTPAGALLGLGCLLRPRSLVTREGSCVVGWCVGAMIYALLLFPIFSSFHDYYSLPLLAPVSLAIAFGIDNISKFVHKKAVRSCFVVGTVLLIAGLSLRMLFKSNRFDIDEQRLQVGRLIKEHTQPDDLVLSLTLGRSTGWSDPRILYYSNRRGWAIDFDQLDREAFDLYREHHVRWAALLVTPERWPVSNNRMSFWDEYAGRCLPVVGFQGDALGYLFLFDVAGE